MYENIEVICLFKAGGGIVPIKVKFEDEEQQVHVFKILRYKQPATHVSDEPGYYSPSRLTPHILDFECYINVFNAEKRIILRYFPAHQKWDLLFM